MYADDPWRWRKAVSALALALALTVALAANAAPAGAAEPVQPARAESGMLTSAEPGTPARVAPERLAAEAATSPAATFPTVAAPQARRRLLFIATGNVPKGKFRHLGEIARPHGFDVEVRYLASIPAQAGPSVFDGFDAVARDAHSAFGMCAAQASRSSRAARTAASMIFT